MNLQCPPTAKKFRVVLPFRRVTLSTLGQSIVGGREWFFHKIFEARSFKHPHSNVAEDLLKISVHELGAFVKKVRRKI